MARAKLELIKPDEVNMEEYEVSCLLKNYDRILMIDMFRALSFRLAVADVREYLRNPFKVMYCFVVL